jgi:hypothetical protein
MGSVFVAVVHDAGGVIFLAAAVSRRRLFDRVGSYVRRQAPSQLYAEEASVVHGLLDRGFSERAVRYYFAHVGRRWGRERLHLQFLPRTAGAPSDRVSEGEATASPSKPVATIPGCQPYR